MSIPTEYSATGTGIGLYLCHKILDAHGGTITAQSMGLGHGTVFLIRLPRKIFIESDIIKQNLKCGGYGKIN